MIYSKNQELIGTTKNELNTKKVLEDKKIDMDYSIPISTKLTELNTIKVCAV